MYVYVYIYIYRYRYVQPFSQLHMHILNKH